MKGISSLYDPTLYDEGYYHNEDDVPSSTSDGYSKLKQSNRNHQMHATNGNGCC